jgi:DUF4097 and DUF4098 domain-containing protein YvlB
MGPMKRFDTPAPIAVTATLAVGILRVIATDRTDTVVSISPTDGGRAADVRDAEQTRVDYLDGQLTIKAPRLGNWSLFNKPGSIDVTIELPTGSRLTADSQVGAIATTGRLGDCRIQFSVGDIQLDQTGSLRASSYGVITANRICGRAEITKSGAVRIHQVDGDATVKVSNGDCWIGAITGELQARTANGSITVDSCGSNTALSTANGDLRADDIAQGSTELKTSYGSIEVGVRPGTAALMDVSTKLGTIHNRMAQSAAPDHDEKTAEVHAHTHYGNIILRNS